MLIATYGTLRKGEYNHYLLQNSKFLGISKTSPAFTLYTNQSFPFLFPDGNTEVVIEIYEVDTLTLRNLYSLEGYTGTRNDPRNWYDTMDVETAWGTAEIFITKTKPNLPVIRSGDWKHEN